MRGSRSVRARLVALERKLTLEPRNDPSVIYIDSLIDAIKYAHLEPEKVTGKTVIYSKSFQTHVLPFIRDSRRRRNEQMPTGAKWKNS